MDLHTSVGALSGKKGVSRNLKCFPRGQHAFSILKNRLDECLPHISGFLQGKLRAFMLMRAYPSLFLDDLNNALLTSDSAAILRKDILSCTKKIEVDAAQTSRSK